METEEENLSEEKKLSLGQEVPVSQVFQINFVAKINTDMAHFRDAINICVGSPATYFVFWDQLILLKRNMFYFYKWLCCLKIYIFLLSPSVGYLFDHRCTASSWWLICGLEK